MIYSLPPLLTPIHSPIPEEPSRSLFQAKSSSSLSPMFSAKQCFHGDMYNHCAHDVLERNNHATSSLINLRLEEEAIL
ncbi:hypothetical protein EYF80_064992 [Liparis tanakae]|uniref:Uncharacterized protein n=1 Tax=Liparis tanakae TaxID=230148 RepID=A0A4Z2E974_9TELE|nr:hypothetical protein EYF80_064992 [Liparis tanakae]